MIIGSAGAVHIVQYVYDVLKSSKVVERVEGDDGSVVYRFFDVDGGGGRVLLLEIAVTGQFVFMRFRNGSGVTIHVNNIDDLAGLVLWLDSVVSSFSSRPVEAR